MVLCLGQNVFAGLRSGFRACLRFGETLLFGFGATFRFGATLRFGFGALLCFRFGCGAHLALFRIRCLEELGQAELLQIVSVISYRTFDTLPSSVATERKLKHLHKVSVFDTLPSLFALFLSNGNFFGTEAKFLRRTPQKLVHAFLPGAMRELGIFHYVAFAATPEAC